MQTVHLWAIIDASQIGQDATENGVAERGIRTRKE